MEVISSSNTGFDDAIKNAVAETSKTVRNIDFCLGKRWQHNFLRRYLLSIV